VHRWVCRWLSEAVTDCGGRAGLKMGGRRRRQEEEEEDDAEEDDEVREKEVRVGVGEE
jgi:hypothetical protein